jgi:integral membrane sensor domain MASE1
MCMGKPVYISVHPVCSVPMGRPEEGILWIWRYRWLSDAIRVLGTKPCFSEIATSVLKLLSHLFQPAEIFVTIVHPQMYEVP